MHAYTDAYTHTHSTQARAHMRAHARMRAHMHTKSCTPVRRRQHRLDHRVLPPRCILRACGHRGAGVGALLKGVAQRALYVLAIQLEECRGGVTPPRLVD